MRINTQLRSIPLKAGLTVILLIWCMGLLGCAGDGSGLEDDDTTPVQPTLASIQANIFSSSCALSGCHQGPAAPEGLRLDSESETFNSLVDVPSLQRTDINLLRVERGDPELSYIVWKIEGRVGIINARMPSGLAPLAIDQIDAVRQWIQDGALP